MNRLKAGDNKPGVILYENPKQSAFNKFNVA
jgi:hypothetical protein